MYRVLQCFSTKRDHAIRIFTTYLMYVNVPAQGSAGLTAIQQQLVAALQSGHDMIHGTHKYSECGVINFFHQDDSLVQRMYCATHHCGSGSFGTVFRDKSAQVRKGTTHSSSTKSENAGSVRLSCR